QVESDPVFAQERVAQWPHGNGKRRRLAIGAAVELRIIALEPVGYGGHIGARGFACGDGRKSGDHLYAPPAGIGTGTAEVCGGHRIRDIQVDWLTEGKRGVIERETFLEHADDSAGKPVDVQAAADDPRIGSEGAAPEVVTEDHGVAGSVGDLGFRKHAAERRLRTEERKVSRGD